MLTGEEMKRSSDELVQDSDATWTVRSCGPASVGVASLGETQIHTLRTG